MSKRRPILSSDEIRFADAGSGIELRQLASDAETNGTYDLAVERLAAEGEARGTRSVETGFHVLSGSLRVDIGGVPRTLSAGGFLHVPAGTNVEVSNETTAEVEYLVVEAPAAADHKTAPREAGIVLMKPEDGRCVGVVGDLYRFLVTGEQTDRRYALIEAIVPPGGGPPPHFHTREEEFFFILEGEVDFLIDGEWRRHGKEGFANMPAGFTHAFANRSEKTARMLIGVAPAGLEGMFFEIGEPLADRNAAAPAPSHEQIGRLLEVARKYGVEILPPEA